MKLSIYTITKAKEILKAAVEAVREFANCIQVTYFMNGGRCSCFLSKGLFLGNASAQSLPQEFGWADIPKIKPGDVYYKNSTVQVWKLCSWDWATYGHFLIIDAAAKKWVASVSGSYGGVWERVVELREAYFNYCAESLGF